MKYFYLGVLCLAIIIGITYQYNNSESVIAVSLDNKIPSPDALWTKQQERKKSFIESKLDVVQQDEKLDSLNQKKDVLVSKPEEHHIDNIPTPDELWEQQHKENREFDLPATIPDIPVITAEQLEAESQARKRDLSNDLGTVVDPLSENPNQIEYDEKPAVEASIEVMPFELIEMEASSSGVNEEQEIEPLIDPQTGISDRELMQAQDSEPAIESEYPVN